MEHNTEGEQQDVFEALGALENETPYERAGRHYAEERSRYATVEAVTQLASALASVTRAQAVSSDAISAMARQITTMERSVDLMRGWMEGTVSIDGTRTPGFIDQIGLFRRTRTTVVALLYTAATSLIGILVVTGVHLVFDVIHPTGGHP